MKLKKINIIIGSFIILISLLWIYFFAHLLYAYQFNKEILWLFMYPNWVLIVNIIIGIIGIIIGILLIKNKLSIRKSSLIVIIILIVGFFFHFFHQCIH